jgi:hypothetical protein
MKQKSTNTIWRLKSLAYRAGMLCTLLSCGLLSQAQPVLSSEPFSPPSVEARVRNGLNASEAQLFTPSSPGGITLNPAGNPVWNAGGNSYGTTFYNFKLVYNSCSGTVYDSIDFNNDGDFMDANESVSSVNPTLVNNGFMYVQLFMQGNTSGSHVQLNNFTVNGTNFGSFATTNSASTLTKVYEDAGGIFGDIEVTGTFTFTSNSGLQAIPNLRVSFAESMNTLVFPVQACDTYTWPVNGQTYTSSTTVTVPFGCLNKQLNLTVIPSSNDTTFISTCDQYQWNGNFYTTSGIYIGTTNDCVTEILDLTIIPTAPYPTLACYETATFNQTTCSWDVTGTQPAQPTLACYETASFNTTTCSWDVTGTQPTQPTLACYETASFNTTTCSWDVTGTQPAQPTLACYETASFNTGSCSWDVTGTMPAAPCSNVTGFTGAFDPSNWTLTNTNGGNGGVTATSSTVFLVGSDTGIYGSSFTDYTVTVPCNGVINFTWDYSTADFASFWDPFGYSVNGVFTPLTSGSGTTEQGTASVNVLAGQTFAFTIYSTDNNFGAGVSLNSSFTVNQQLPCYQTASFNTTTCSWDVTGTQPAAPTGLACYETATFNNGTCSWDVTGTQPAQPTLACYETASFNTTTCSWDVTGTQPAQPTLACYETASFNTTTCSWDVTGSPNPVISSTVSSCVSYFWALNGVTYTTSGINTYFDAMNCQDYELNLTINSNPVINAPIAARCPNAASVTIAATPLGGNYDVANPYTGPLPASYTYTYTDANGCTSSATSSIVLATVDPAIIQTPIVAGTTTATINWDPVPGSTKYYLWYKPVFAPASAWLTPTFTSSTTFNLVNLAPGTLYEVKIRNNNDNCSLLGSFSSPATFTTGTEPCGIATTMNPTTIIPVRRAVFSWNAAAGAAQYNIWFKEVSSATWMTSTFSSAVLSYTTATLPAGNYEVKIRNRCGNVPNYSAFGPSTYFTITSNKGLVDEITTNVNVFPNPVTDKLNVEFEATEAQNIQAKLFDLTGRLIKTVQFNSQVGLNNFTIEMSDFVNGTYMLKVYADDRMIQTSKVQKAK